MNLLKKIFSPTILTISFLLLIFIFYKSEIYWDGGKRNYYIKYYLLSLFLFVFSIISFFFKKKIKEYLIIISITLTFTSYFFEIYLNLKKTINYDDRIAIEVYNDLKDEENILVTYPPFLHMIENYENIFPLSSHSKIKNVFCNESGNYVFYLSDRYGFNKPDEVWDKKIDIILLGDSFTQGSCVNRPSDIGSNLRTLGKNTLNLGSIGNGPLINYAVFNEYIKKNLELNNSIVVYMFFENDFQELKLEKQSKFLKSYLNDNNFSQNLVDKQKNVDELIKNQIFNLSSKKIREYKKTKIIKVLFLTKLRYQISLIKLKKKKIDNNFSEEKIIFKKLLYRVKNFLNKNNSDLILLYLPSYDVIKNKKQYENYDFIKKLSKEMKIKFIDIREEIFKKEQNPLKLFPFELHGHYNIDGYKKVAETIYKFTKD